MFSKKDTLLWKTSFLELVESMMCVCVCGGVVGGRGSSSLDDAEYDAAGRRLGTLAAVGLAF